SCSVGQCNAQGTACQCTADSQCPSGKCVDVGQGCQTVNGVDQCSGSGTPDAAECVPSNISNCTSNSDCGGIAGTSVEACSGSGGDAGSGPGLGQCQCSASTNCGAGQTCVLGKCTGCTSNAQCTDRTYAATCTGAVGAVTGQCCSSSNPSSCGLNSHLFPEACLQSPMSDQEKALEFMFFDLTACVTPDTGTPTAPPVMLTPQTFALDFVSSCPMGTKAQWREFDYQASFPNPVNGSSIAFSAQTGPAGADASAYLPASPLALVTSTANTNVPNYDVVLLDTAPGGTGKFTTASPPLVSQGDLRIWVTMTPTADMLSSPTLLNWKVQYDCPPAE
ncbi:MAG TPA: hypothetical protein VKU41_30750, partial [Polyangiaceae bacterium]|nr:hypothetical protein [Polyangiaceae bacterium]